MKPKADLARVNEETANLLVVQLYDTWLVHYGSLIPLVFPSALFSERVMAGIHSDVSYEEGRAWLAD